MAARIWLPTDAVDRPVPAILEYLPYRKRDGTAARDAHNHVYFAGHGYVCVRVDIRGNGESEGLMWDEYLQQEQDDALEVIAWIAARPWCDGNVGMMGISWGGFNALQVAARRPPALKAIMVRKGQVDDLVAEYGYVVVDECHHIPAASFERALSEVKARYVTGLTATPQRRDGHHPIISMQLGPVRFTVDPRSQAGQRPFRHRVSIRETGFTAPQHDAGAPIQALYRMLANDEQRNELILNDVIQSLEDGRSPIVLTERKDHFDFLASRLRAFSRHLS